MIKLGMTIRICTQKNLRGVFFHGNGNGDKGPLIVTSGMGMGICPPSYGDLHPKGNLVILYILITFIIFLIKIKKTQSNLITLS